MERWKDIKKIRKLQNLTVGCGLNVTAKSKTLKHGVKRHSNKWDLVQDFFRILAFGISEI